MADDPLYHTTRALAYAEGVRDGEIPACKWVKLAARRMIRDLERQHHEEEYPYYYDAEKAEDACSRIQLLPHIKGKWAGSPILLEQWQSFILCNVFGWLRKDNGKRRYRTVYIEVPRKNAKSTLSAGVGLYMLACDGEHGAEVYSAATTRDQARIVFNDAQAMARKSAKFRAAKGVSVNAHNINVLTTASKFEPLSADAHSLDGLNVHFAAIDELHAHKTRHVYDVIETATGAREQSLVWCITTAGVNRAGICFEVRSYLTKVLEGVTEDDTFFGVIYTIDEGDDWKDPAVWAKANPNFGVSVFPDDIERLCRKAATMPSALNNFLTKRLNVWVNADTAWLNMDALERCADPGLSDDMFEGEEAIVALDLASKIDIAAKVKLFTRRIDDKTHYYAFGEYYLPEHTVETSTNSQYAGWARDGLLIVTPGNIIDFGYIEESIRDDSRRFHVTEVPYDPFQATQLATRLMSEGFPMIETRPTVLNFSEPMKELEAIILDGRFHYNGDPVLTWMFSNVVCHLDAKDNIYPRKESPDAKIDGVVALIMAIGVAVRKEIADMPQVIIL